MTYTRRSSLTKCNVLTKLFHLIYGTLIILYLFTSQSFSQFTSSGCNTSQSFILSSCDSLLSPSGKVWTLSGIYLDTIPNVAGCDSILFYNLTVNSTVNTHHYISSCDSLLSINGKVWYTSGIYQDTTQTSKGCDSILTYHYTQGQTIFDTLRVNSCDSLISPSGKVWKTSGIYGDTVSHITSCDSIYTYELTISKSTYDTIYSSVCDSFISPTGKIWRTSGIFYDTLTNSAGCPLYSTYFISTGETKFNLPNVFVCDTFISPSGKIWTSSGTFLDTISHATSCDSLYTITLRVGAFLDTIADTACDVFVSPTGKTIESTGIFYDTVNGKNCDSIIYTLEIVVYSSNKDTISFFDCDTVFSTITNNYWTRTGVYVDTIYENQYGCDSSIYAKVKIGNSFNPISQAHCWSYTLPSGSRTLTQSGWYYDTLVTPSGCDSVLYITLEINIADTTVYKRPGMLLAFVAGANYQWLDCNNGMSAISGATSSQFTPSVLGTYALEVRKYGCVDTSSCYVINSYAGLEENNNEIHPLVYPNPFESQINIGFQGLIPSGKISILNVSGKVVYTEFINRRNKITLELNQLKKGMYLLQVETESNVKTIKLIKN